MINLNFFGVRLQCRYHSAILNFSKFLNSFCLKTFRQFFADKYSGTLLRNIFPSNTTVIPVLIDKYFIALK